MISSLSSGSPPLYKIKSIADLAQTNSPAAFLTRKDTLAGPGHFGGACSSSSQRFRGAPSSGRSSGSGSFRRMGFAAGERFIRFGDDCSSAATATASTPALQEGVRAAGPGRARDFRVRNSGRRVARTYHRVARSSRSGPRGATPAACASAASASGACRSAGARCRN